MTKRKKYTSLLLIVVISAALTLFLILSIISFQRRYHHSHGDDDITTLTDTTVSRILNTNRNDNNDDSHASHAINENIPNNNSNEYDNNNEPNQQKIPYNLIFTYETNILHTRFPPYLHKNIVHTIESYKSAIRSLHNSTPPPIRVMFLDDPSCLNTLSIIYPSLVPHVKSETFGVFRGDVCRIVALYRYGGYYFDVDMEVVEPLILSPSITFSTVIQPRKEFFQSFVAATKSHPVLRRTLGYMLRVYEGHRTVILLGTMTLRWGYDDVMERRRNTKGLERKGERAEEEMPHPEDVMLLEEANLSKSRYGRKYPGLIRDGYFGCCCNFVVHDPRKEIVYFYSRIVGHSKRCMF